MYKIPILLKKTFVIGIFILFLCMSCVSSIGIIIEEEISSNKPLKLINRNFEFIFHDKIVFAWREPQTGLCNFFLDDPENVTQLWTTTAPIFFSGGTWTNDGRLFEVDLFSGGLYEIDPETQNMWSIGGGGNHTIGGLAFNPINSKLYGAGIDSLFEIDIETGEHTCIGDYGEGPEVLVSIAFDYNGVLYGWDLGSDRLWNFNIETGEASEIGSLGINTSFAGGSNFDFRTDTLYISAFTTKPGLYECDVDTGQCKLVGDFDELTQLISALTIPYDCPNHPPYRPTIDGPKIGIPGKEYCIEVCSVDPNGDHLFYYIDWGDGSYEDWFGPCISGINVKKCHIYPAISGLYEIRVKVKDLYDRESDWGKMYVFMLKNRMTDNLFLHRFLTFFPILKNC